MSKAGSDAASVVERLSSVTLTDDIVPTAVPATSEWFVYVVHDLNDEDQCDFVKIGVTNNPVDRLKSLQSGNPRKLGFLYVFRPCPIMSAAREQKFGCKRFAAFDLERYLHKIFAPKRMMGEWFIYDKEMETILSAMAMCSHALHPDEYEQ